MRTDPIRWFPPAVRERYPHLSPEDTEVWSRFVERRGSRYEAFSYDVRVGEGYAPPAGEDADLVLMWIALTRKRIDVVARGGGLHTLIEVKGHCSLGGLGQILGYGCLWPASYPSLLPFAQLVIYRTIDPDAVSCMEHYGVGRLAMADF